MGKTESIIGNVADVRVHDDDMHVSAGKWASGTYISGTTTWTGTAACTVLMAFLQGSAAAGAGTVVHMGTTANSTAICCMTSTAAYSTNNLFSILNTVSSVIQSYIVTASTCRIVSLGAGESVVISATGTAGGKYYFHYITTPT